MSTNACHMKLGVHGVCCPTSPRVVQPSLDSTHDSAPNSTAWLYCSTAAGMVSWAGTPHSTGSHEYVSQLYSLNKFSACRSNNGTTSPGNLCRATHQLTAGCNSTMTYPHHSLTQSHSPIMQHSTMLCLHLAAGGCCLGNTHTPRCKISPWLHYWFAT